MTRKTLIQLMAFWLFLFYLPLLKAQDVQLIDSLSIQLTAAKEDSNKVILLNDLAWELKISDPDQAKNYLKESVILSQKINYLKGEAQAYNNHGVVEAIQDNGTAAVKFYQKALALREQIGDRKGVASLYNNIANLQSDGDDFIAALINFRKSMQIREELNDTLRMARVAYNISVVYENNGIYDEALTYALEHLDKVELLKNKEEIARAQNQLGNVKFELERFEESLVHYEKAMEISKELEDQWNMAEILNSMGNINDAFGEQKEKEKSIDIALQLSNKALDYYNQSLAIYTTLDDEEGRSNVFNNIGLVYKNIGTYHKKMKKKDESKLDLQKAHEFLQKSFVIREAKNDKHGIMEVYNGMGDVYRRENKIKEALKYTNLYYELAKELEHDKFKQKAYKDLSRIYNDLKDYKKAYKFRKKYDEIRWSRLDEKRSKDNERKEALYFDNKKKQEIDRQRTQLQLNESELRRATLLKNSFIGGAIALFLLASLLYNRYRIKNQANIVLEEKNKIIKSEKQRSDELLLNILPEKTAEELKKYGKTKAHRYDSVTVLFSDFKSFTSIAEQLSPEELVHELDICFSAFDEIMQQYNIEKIKTIGDAYMCAAGLPTTNETHPIDTINAAMEIQRFMLKFNDKRAKENKPKFEMRIGIHTGPVVAGIVGRKKFAYDIWGDTVNLAARMESGGEPGKINISEDTFQLIKNQFDCRYRGKIDVKNKGEVDMYFVEQVG